MPVKVLHCITGLYSGGAEQMLLKLLSKIDQSRFQSEVLTLVGGPLEPAFKAIGVPVHNLKMQIGGVPTPTTIYRLARTIRAINPDCVQGWMYHGNLASYLGCRLAGRSTPVLWNVRHSVYDLAHEKRSTRAYIKLGALLSKKIAGIVYTVDISARQHEVLGFNKNKTVVIPNGFDTSRFAPSLEHYRSVRAEYNVPSDAKIVGMVGRFDGQKDHANFFRSAKLVAQSDPNVHFFLIGPRIDKDNQQIVDLIRGNGLVDKVHLLGQRLDDVQRYVAAFDVAVLSSAYGEGFPNVIGEAMSSGVLCAVTDVGASRQLVGGIGEVVPIRNPEALARATEKLLTLAPADHQRLTAAGRSRIESLYSIETVVKRYEQLYDESQLRRSSGYQRKTADIT